MYSPTMGRFLQTDPIGYEDQFNLYAYVANDPVNGVDPTGMCAGPLIIPCAIVAEDVVVVAAAAAAMACVAYCPSAEQVKEAIDGVIDKVTPDPIPETGPAPGPSGGGQGERTESDGPQGGTKSEARRRGATDRCIEPLCDASHAGTTETGRCPDCETKKRQEEGRGRWEDDDDRGNEKEERYPPRNRPKEEDR